MYSVGMLGQALVEEFVGAHPVKPLASAKATPEAAASAAGAPGAPPFEAVTYPHLWDGITLSYAAAPDGLAISTYRVDPGADPRRIRLRYNTGLALEADGSLRVQQPAGRGHFTLSAPRAWQDLAGRRVPVKVAFTTPERRQVGFEVGAYDPAYPLLIDPTYAWHTFYGSAGTDAGSSIAVAVDGSVYVTGTSDATWGTPVHPHSGGEDIVVMKFDATGSLLWHTFLGSSGVDRGNGIAVDGSGHVYVTGISAATWGTPLHPFSGQVDIVVLALGSDGALAWHTFYGAGYEDHGSGIALDGTGAVLVTGTSWDPWGAPVDPHGPNGWDTVVLKLAADGAYQWHTFAGANAWNYGYAVAADGGGNVHVTGRASGTWGAPLHAHSGNGDNIAVLKLDGAGAYQWHTFYGGAGSSHEGRAIAIDSAGAVLVTGTSSDTFGTPLHAHSGQTNIVVLKLDGAGAHQWHTFYGADTGYHSTEGRAIAVDGTGSAYIAGGSWGAWGTPLHPYSGYGWDIVVLKLDSAGAHQWNTFYGANATYASDQGDVGTGIARDTSGNLHVTGYSRLSWDAPLHPHTGNGNLDIAVLKLLNGAFSFLDAVNVPLSTTQVSNTITVSDIAGAVPIAVSGDSSSEYAINGGAWTSAPGTVSAGDTVQVRHVSAATHLTSVDTTLTMCAVSDTFTSTTVPVDTTPDPFTFIDPTAVARGAEQISNAITVTGITAATPIAVSGAASSEYAIDGGAWTNVPGSVTNGQVVRARHTSSASFASAVSTTVSIGGVSDTFTSTTLAEDVTPDAFSFAAQTGVTPDTLVLSNVITVTGINSAARVDISGESTVNEYSIAGGAWSSATGSVSNGQTVQVRQRSAATPGVRRRLWLGIGTYVTAFDVTSGADTVPDAFTFVDLANVSPGTTQVSNAVAVTGISAPAPIALSGGGASSMYSIDGGAWISVPATVANGQSVRVRHVSSAAPGGSASTTLTIGGVSDTFTTVTIVDGVPDQFSFVDAPDVLPNTSQVSNAIVVTGINSPAAIAVSGDASSQYAIDAGAWTSAPGTVANGQAVRVRHTSAPGLGVAVHTRLTIASVFDTFTSTTVNRIVQPPTGLEVWSNVGRRITLRWVPPSTGLPPDEYVIVGGRISANGTRGPALVGGRSAAPIVSLDVPAAYAYWIQVQAYRNDIQQLSVPAEVIAHMLTTPAPSIPADLLALVNGSTLDLTWRNTFGGGIPSQVVLDVTGSATLSVPLGLGESYRFSRVPPGTYELRLRAINGAGSSTASDPVTVAFPGRCSGPPLPATAFLAYRVGRTLLAVWQSAASGPAPTRYRVRVAGAYTGSFGVTGRTFSRAVSPGSYEVRVQAVNDCGTSQPTAVQTVLIP